MATCICGCRGETKGGSFLPGHDARYKSHLIKEALADNADALAELEKRNWTKFLDKARNRKVPTERVVKIERQQDDAERGACKSATVQVMRAAAKVLRHTGQYWRTHSDHVDITKENALMIAQQAFNIEANGHEILSDADRRAIQYLKDKTP